MFIVNSYFKTKTMKTYDEKLKEIKEVIEKNHFALQRSKVCTNLGYTVKSFSKSKSVGTVVNNRNGIRVQLTYNKGKYNYALWVIL